MKINILSLYSDILNLYGDTGNIKAINYHLNKLGIDHNIDYLSINDDLDFEKYDLIVIGSGTEYNRDIALDHLLKYKDKVKKAIEDNKFFLVTGNSLSLFGKSIYDKNALDIFNYITLETDRVSEEVILKNKFGKDIYGLINHQDKIENNEDKLFENDGILYKNFYGTTVIGPLLARNPEFLNYFLKRLIKSKDENFKVELNLDLDILAYDQYIEFKKTKVFNSRHS